MKNLIICFLLIPSFCFTQTENDKIKNYRTVFEEINQLSIEKLNNEEIVLKNIQEKISKSKDDYLINGLLIYKAKEEIKLNPKKALSTLAEVKSYLIKNPDYKQLKLFYNTVYGRIIYETQQNCMLSYSIFDENIQVLKSNTKTYDVWNIVFETKTGLINSLLCLQKDQEALEYLKQLENEIKPTNQLKEYIYILSVSGYIHTKFSNYKEGEKYFKKVVYLLEKTNEFSDNYIAACNNLAHIYKTKNNTVEAIKVVEKALLKARKTNDLNSLLLLQNNLGFLYVKKERYREASKLGEAVLKEANDKQYAIHLANANRLLGTTYYYLGYYKKSEAQIDKAIAFFRDFKNPELLRNSLDIKNKLLLKTNQFENAAKVNSEIISLLDSVSLNNNIQNLQKNLVEYETEKKDNQITILKQTSEINAFKIQKQKQYIMYLIVGIFIISVFGFVVYKYQNKINRIQNLSLRSKLTRSQFNPHYINNAFTTLQASLIENNLDENLINYTSDVSRFSRLLLESTFIEEWSLFEEKQMIENYLKTQLYRLENGFEFTIESNLKNEELHALKIPSALTQTVLENAIEHGNFDKKSNGKIEISIQKNNSFVEIQIKNNIVKETENSIEKTNLVPSRGLELTKQRIDIHSKIYKLPCNFNFIKNNDEATVIFDLPILTA